MFVAEEFFYAKKLRTLQGAKINSSRPAGLEQIFASKRKSRPRFLAKIPKTPHKPSFDSRYGEEFGNINLLRERRVRVDKIISG